MSTKVTFIAPDSETYPNMIFVIVGSTGYWSYGDDFEEALGNYPGMIEDFTDRKETLSVFLCHKSTSITADGKWTRESGTLAPMMIAVLGGKSDGKDILEPIGSLVDYYDDEDADEDDLSGVKEYVAN